eukprot:3509778-Rhodomonas_salina.1
MVFVKGAEATFNEEAITEMAGVNAITAAANNKVTIYDNFKCDDCSPGAAKDSSSSASASDKTALIAGVCGGVGGAVLVGAGAMLWMRSRKVDEAVMAARASTSPTSRPSSSTTCQSVCELARDCRSKDRVR